MKLRHREKCVTHPRSYKTSIWNLANRHWEPRLLFVSIQSPQPLLNKSGWILLREFFGENYSNAKFFSTQDKRWDFSRATWRTGSEVCLFPVLDDIEIGVPSAKGIRCERSRARRAYLLWHQVVGTRNLWVFSYGPVVGHMGEKILWVWAWGGAGPCTFQPLRRCLFERRKETGGSGWEAWVTRILGLRKGRKRPFRRVLHPSVPRNSKREGSRRDPSKTSMKF